MDAQHNIIVDNDAIANIANVNAPAADIQAHGANPDAANIAHTANAANAVHEEAANANAENLMHEDATHANANAVHVAHENEANAHAHGPAVHADAQGNGGAHPAAWVFPLNSPLHLFLHNAAREAWQASAQDFRPAEGAIAGNDVDLPAAMNRAVEDLLRTAGVSEWDIAQARNEIVAIVLQVIEEGDRLLVLRRAQVKRRGRLTRREGREARERRRDGGNGEDGQNGGAGGMGGAVMV